MTQRRVALDVMGGDDAPDATLQGALAATQGDGAIEPERILLVGDRDRIEALLAEKGGNPGFEIRHASEVIEMGDSPARALKAMYVNEGF